MSSYGLTHLPLSRPCWSRSFLPLVTSSVLTSGATLSANFCRVKRCFKPYQNEHNSVKDTGGKGQKPCNIDLKILSRFSFAAKVFGHASHSTELVRIYICVWLVNTLTSTGPIGSPIICMWSPADICEQWERNLSFDSAYVRGAGTRDEPLRTSAWEATDQRNLKMSAESLPLSRLI